MTGLETQNINWHCNVCRWSEFTLLGVRSDGQKVLTCRACGMGVVENIPLDPSIFYQDNYYNHPEERNSTGYTAYDQHAEHGVLWAAQLVKVFSTSGTVLDIGCADGFLLKAIGSKYQAFGIEANAKAAKSASASGIRILGSDILDEDLVRENAGRFDVITAIAVFEHITDFKGAVKAALAMLKPDGVLLFEVPLISQKNNNSTWFNSSLEHIFYPTNSGLRNLFELQLATPMIGGELKIKDYASTFVGIATKKSENLAKLKNVYDKLNTKDISKLSFEDRYAQLLFKVIHAADPLPEHFDYIDELFPGHRQTPFLARCLTLWRADYLRLTQTQQYLAEVETAKIWHSENSIRWQQAYTNGIREAPNLKLLDELKKEIEVNLNQSLEVPLTDQESKKLRLFLSEYEELKRGFLDATQSRDAALIERDSSISSSMHTLVQLNAASDQIRVLRESNEQSQKIRDKSLTSLELVSGELHSVYRSKSWQITEPLRGIVSLMIQSKARIRYSLGIAQGAFTLQRVKTALSLIKKGDFSTLGAAALHVSKESKKQLEQELVAEVLSPAMLLENQPLVSVVIPCFNYGSFITAAIESILAQTLKNIEIIVVDGGSTDVTTRELLNTLERPRTRIFLREGRHLVGDNRNFGIERATGRYICCLDADDTVDVTYLEKAVFHLETYGYDVVSTAINFVGAREGTLDVLEFPNLSDMVKGNHILTCAVFRRSMWLDVGGYFDVGIGEHHVAEDWDFWVRIAANGARIRNLSREYLFNYRIHKGGSLSSAEGNKSLIEQQAVILKRNEAMLTAAAFNTSAKQQSRYLRCPPETTALATGWKAYPASQAKTLILTIPFMLVGGAERLLSGLCKHLSDNGWHVIVVATLEQDPKFGSSAEWFKACSNEVYSLPFIAGARNLPDFLKYLVASRKPDCILNAGSRLAYELFADFKATQPRLTIVDILFNCIGHVESHQIFKEHISFALAENLEVYEWLQKTANWPIEKIHLVSSGVDTKALRPNTRPLELVNDLAISDEDLVIGFSGRLSEEKAPDVFIDIAHLSQDIPNLRFVMTGAGPLENQIAEKVAQLSKYVRFDFVGLVPDVYPFLALYDLLVLPSRIDGRPLVVMEALAFGVPVIASNVGGLPSLITDGENGYLAPIGQPQSFVEHIRLLAQDREKLAQLKLGARRTAEETLEATIAYREYDTVLQKAIYETTNK
jgi:O-antigen biosynthesis protein